MLMILQTDTKIPPVKPQSDSKKVNSDAKISQTTEKKDSEKNKQYSANKTRYHDAGKKMDLKQVSEIAMKKLSEALNKKVEHVASIKREGEGWQGTVEVVEEEYLPGKNLRSMNDIIGLYDITLDDEGDIINWQKRKTRKRGDTVV
jgi:hypothetical protein